MEKTKTEAMKGQNMVMVSPLNSTVEPQVFNVNPMTKLLQCMYTAAGIFLLSPLTIRFDPNCGQYYVTNRGLLFKILVVMEQVGVIVRCLWLYHHESAYLAYNTKMKSSFNKEFHRLVKIIYIPLILTIFSTFWTSKRRLRNLLHLIHNISICIETLGKNSLTKHGKMMKMRLLGVGFGVYIVAWGLVDSITYLNIHHHGFAGVFRSVQNYMHGWALDKDSHWGQSIVAIFMWLCAATEWSDNLLGVVSLAYAIVLYYLVNSFIQNLPSIDFIQIADFRLVMNIFRQLCKLSEAMDEMIGLIIFCNIFGFLPFYAKFAFESLQMDFVEGMRRSMYLVKVGACLLLAAEANSKVGQLVGWLQELQVRKLKFEDGAEVEDFHKDVAIALSQIQNNKIGLKGKCFTITYSFVGSVVGLIVTYGIILSQLQPSTQ